MTVKGEILPEQYSSRSEARPVIQQALTHYREAKRATIQVMADLRRLQDRGVHLLYGERNFSNWAEQTFEGMSAGNVKQLTRAGGVALALEENGRLDLRKPSGVGTTGLRELSVISNDYGVEKMIEVFDTAKGLLEPGKEVADTTVKAAMQLLMPPPAPRVEVPPSLPAEDEEEGEDTVKSELQERINHIQDLLWDVSGGDKAAYREAQDEMERLGKELRGESNTQDQKWLESGR